MPRNCIRMRDILPYIEQMEDDIIDGGCQVRIVDGICEDLSKAVLRNETERRRKKSVLKACYEMDILEKLRAMAEDQRSRNLNAYDVLWEMEAEASGMVMDAKTEDSKDMFRYEENILVDMLWEIQKQNEEEYVYECWFYD